MSLSESLFSLDEEIDSLAERKGLTIYLLTTARGEANTAAPGKFESVVKDHKLAANPYHLLYEDDWESVINETTYMKNFVSIRDFAMHMTVESNRLMEGTMHEGEALFKRDALSLLTAEKTKKWMRETMVNRRFSKWDMLSMW